jgi:hypothetical protein
MITVKRRFGYTVDGLNVRTIIYVGVEGSGWRRVRYGVA